MIQKPYKISIMNSVIDTNKDYKFSWKTSGDVSASFSLAVYKASDNSLVWQLPQTFSYAMSYTIPAGSIPNGDTYQLVITVWNSTNQSASSQPVIFTASSSPTAIVEPIGTVGSNTYLFSATYSQAENDPLSSYIVNLYNSNNVLLLTSGTLTDGLMEYRFDTLKSGQSYFIEFVITSKKGLTNTSGLISFDVVYDNPNMYFEVTADKIPEKAGVKLNWSINQVVGKTTIAPIYLNNEELDVTNGKLYFDEGYEIPNDFTLKIWFRDIAIGTDLITMNGSNGSIRLQYKTTDNSFHVYKKVDGYNYHYSYPMIFDDGTVFISPFQIISVSDNTIYAIYLCIQQINGRMNIYGEKITRPQISLANTTFDQLKGQTFNLLNNDTFS